MSNCREEVFSQEAGLVCRKTIAISNLKDQLNQEKQKTESLRVQLAECRKARYYFLEEDRKGIERIKHLESDQLNIFNQEKQRREDAEKALGFYADQNSWRKDSQDFGSSMSTMWQISAKDLYEQNEATQYGGATAKAHFKQYKQ